MTPLFANAQHQQLLRRLQEKLLNDIEAAHMPASVRTLAQRCMYLSVLFAYNENRECTTDYKYQVLYRVEVNTPI